RLLIAKEVLLFIVFHGDPTKEACMLRSLKAICLSIFLLAMVAVAILKSSPLNIAGAYPEVGARSPGLASTAVVRNRLKGNAYADGPYTVQGNAIIGAD